MLSHKQNKLHLKDVVSSFPFPLDVFCWFLCARKQERSVTSHQQKMLFTLIKSAGGWGGES